MTCRGIYGYRSSPFSNDARISLQFGTDLNTKKTFEPTLQNRCSKEDNTQDADVITRLQLRIHHAEDYFPKMELAIRGRSAQQVQDVHCRPFSILLRRLIGDPMSLEIGYSSRKGRGYIIVPKLAINLTVPSAFSECCS